jgi:hypothetical protein
MEMAGTHATLVDSPDFADSVTATIPRAEFEAALASEEPAELFLEVRQPDDAGARASTDVSIAWSRADLERLLEQTAGPAITLAFDRDELERILAEDVEAHGLREKAAVLTVAFVAAAGGATAAAAHEEAGGLTGGATTPSYVAVHDEATLSDRGITPLAVSSHDEATLAARGIEAEPLAASHDEATLAARGIEAEPLAASHDEATLAARGIAPAAPATGAGDGGFAVDVPFDASTGAAVGGGLAGLGLLITAAGFAVRRQRSTRPA